MVDHGAVMSQLQKKTCELLRARPRDLTYERIATEAELPLEFVRRLAQERAKHPSVIYVERLYVFLAGKPLSL